MLAAVVAAEMPVQAQDTLTCGIGGVMGARSERDAASDLDALEFVRPCRERCIEHIGLANPEPEIEPHFRSNEPGGRLCRDVLRDFPFSPNRHQWTLPG